MRQGMMTRAMGLAVLSGMAAGLAYGEEQGPTRLGIDAMSDSALKPVVDIAHIYYNAVTGERIVTVIRDGQTAPADTGDSVSVWSTAGPAPDCADGSMGTPQYFPLDNPGTSLLSTEVTLLDYGDIESDTVVDCVTVHWIVAHPDTDTDFDSIGDGVEELAGRWQVWDADNGRELNSSTRLPLMDVLFFNLPGNIAGPGFVSGYTLDIDLAAGFTGTDLSFEIGDTDGDCQAAAFCNSSVEDYDGMFRPVGLCDRDFDGLLDSDLDGDGLFDFSWTVRFYQPGTGNDFDSDGDMGTPAPSDADTIGIRFGYPVGLFELPGGGYSIDPSIDNAGTGAEGRAVRIGVDGTFAPFVLGGYECPTIDNPFRPAAIFEVNLLGPTDIGDCFPDLNGDGVLNFFDISTFLICWQNQDPQCDCDGNGVLDFFDVSCFIAQYNNGCQDTCPECLP